MICQIKILVNDKKREGKNLKLIGSRTARMKRNWKTGKAGMTQLMGETWGDGDGKEKVFLGREKY
ncbi:MAG TPA: hypothetical protein VI757_16070 [Bacteroidia bacterium]|nr:hypothetical protein [Bacteroidia bacterium]